MDAIMYSHSYSQAGPHQLAPTSCQRRRHTQIRASTGPAETAQLLCKAGLTLRVPSSSTSP